jgi:hypothetical protein
VGAARGLRVLPAHAPRRDDAACTAACVEEQARRAEYLRRVIIEHHEERDQLIREYEQLADKFNNARAEVSAWRAWMAQWSTYPALRKDA